MEQKKYISWGQLLLLLFMCRVFTLMTFVPLAAEGSGLSLRLTAAAISSVIQAIILIPVVLLKDSVTSVLIKKCRPLGILTSYFYLHFFILYTAGGLMQFRDFLGTRFFPGTNGIISIIVLLIVCVYCSCLGIEALGRSGVLLFWIFIVAVIAMVFSSAENYNTSNLYFDNIQPDSLFSAIVDDLARNGEIVALTFLAKHVREKLRCGVYGLLASNLVLVEAAMLMIATVLGDFAVLTDYPFLALGTFGGTRFIQRGDSLYLIVWTITAVINNALFLHLSAGLIEEIFPKLKFRTSIAAALVFAVTLFYTLTGMNFSAVYNLLCSGYTITVLSGIFPFIALIISKRKAVIKKNEA